MKKAKTYKEKMLTFNQEKRAAAQINNEIVEPERKILFQEGKLNEIINNEKENNLVIKEKVKQNWKKTMEKAIRKFKMEGIRFRGDPYDNKVKNKLIVNKKSSETKWLENNDMKKKHVQYEDLSLKFQKTFNNNINNGMGRLSHQR
jgi:hypothetical protein